MDNPNPNLYIRQNIRLLGTDILGPQFGVLPLGVWILTETLILALLYNLVMQLQLYAILAI
jgi:hypothetical protein